MSITALHYMIIDRSIKQNYQCQYSYIA